MDMIKLPIPLNFKGDFFEFATLKRLTAGNLNNVSQVTERSGHYKGVLSLLSFGIESFSGEGKTISGFSNITEVLKNLAIPCVEILSLKLMSEIRREQKFITGFWNCPLCKSAKTWTHEDRHTLDEMEIINQDVETYGKPIEIILEYPVIIKNSNTGEVLKHIESICFLYPTLGNAIDAELKNRAGNNDFKILADCIYSINDEEFDFNEKRKYGEIIIEKTDTIDMEEISKSIYEFGLTKKVDLYCNKCQCEWSAGIDVNGFFL